MPKPQRDPARREEKGTGTFSAAATSGNIVAQVQRAFIGLGQMTREWQSRGAAVNTSTTPSVQYAYSEMPSGANHLRLTSITYPDGYVLTYNYASGLSGDISRLSSLSDAGGTLESYDYLGLGTVVRRSHSTPAVDLTFLGTGPGSGVDQYVGLDSFGRVIDHNWKTSGSPTDRFTYTYDRDGNRLTKGNSVNSSFNESYSYDSLNQLTNFTRGAHTQAFDFDAMSATLVPRWFASADFRDRVPELQTLRLDEKPDELDTKAPGLEERWVGEKPIQAAGLSTDDKNMDKVAEFVEKKHQSGSLTLVIVNTVDRSRLLYAALHKRYEAGVKPKRRSGKAPATQETAPAPPELKLIHSRFRPHERAEWMGWLTAGASSLPAAGRIVISTQVIEAGVDLSARTLITELAPWPSLVQRFGRCNRRGEFGQKGSR